MSDPGELTRTRADARRNTERVQEVALDILARYGTDATIMDIAREAGVGKATVYRNFPTKAALLAFAAEHHGRWLVERIDETLAADDGWPGFRRLVEETMVRIRREPILLEALRPNVGSEPTIAEAVDERLVRVVDILTAQGSMRADATVEDLGLLIIGTSEYLASRSADSAACVRAAELVVSAMRAR